MFDEHYKDGSFAGETSRKWRLIGVRFGILAVIAVIGLGVAGYLKWSKYSLHNSPIERHEKADAQFIQVYDGNGNSIYMITYTFNVNGKTYENVFESKVRPKYPRGIVWYNPDNPDENELQPIPKEEEYKGTDRK
ncbi:MAG TPA: hypothetical protein PLP07_10765 [Pyrinomonadaceae bacterium]|nr:hypothetical protein [Chloracidobacterium sp.]MBP9936174.1 hypothetical protein [Pyrinomonadaceae bacterium]MBK7804486.1 hypothetical protein [Chloracidobacterium sp.]MBK9438887.1 hypothetical protein [Chloracidobacterium sp.]MBL0240418.1 hypothetical protein [Chloracidobacterium sp.]